MTYLKINATFLDPTVENCWSRKKKTTQIIRPQVKRFEYSKSDIFLLWGWRAGIILTLRTQISYINKNLPGISYFTEHLHNLSLIWTSRQFSEVSPPAFLQMRNERFRKWMQFLMVTHIVIGRGSAWISFSDSDQCLLCFLFFRTFSELG